MRFCGKSIFQTTETTNLKKGNMLWEQHPRRNTQNGAILGSPLQNLRNITCTLACTPNACPQHVVVTKAINCYFCLIIKRHPLFVASLPRSINSHPHTRTRRRRDKIGASFNTHHVQFGLRLTPLTGKSALLTRDFRYEDNSDERCNCNKLTKTPQPQRERHSTLPSLVKH